MADAQRRESVLRILARHECMGAAEKAHLERMRTHAMQAKDPFDKRADDGHFTASALVVSPDLDQVLLLHHRKLDRWLQCGGHIEADDADPALAALREAREETGLAEVRPHPLWEDLLDVDVHRIPQDDRMDAHDHLDLRYLVVADPQAPLARSEAETKALHWFAWEEAYALIDDPGLDRLFQKVRRIREAVGQSGATSRRTG